MLRCTVGEQDQDCFEAQRAQPLARLLNAYFGFGVLSIDFVTKKSLNLENDRRFRFSRFGSGFMV